MKNIVFVTSNPNKAKYFSELIGMTIEHQKIDVAEIQSLDLLEIARHKAVEAYNKIRQPVIVEDASVVINSMGKLPGPLIKWFVEGLGLEGICRLADISSDRSAEASDTFVYYDGEQLVHFEGKLKGSIAMHPTGDSGYDWDKIFIAHYSQQTNAEMNHEDYTKVHLLIKPIEQVREFLSGLDK